MGKSITVEEVVTRYGFVVDSKPLEKLNKLQDKLKKGLKIIGGIATVTAAALFGIANSVAAVGDEAIKTAQSLGITAEALQELRFAARRAGITNEQVGVGLKTLSRNLQDFKRGAGEAKISFKQIGISKAQVDGLETVEQLLPLLADRFQALPDGILKSAAAQKIFGESGTAMIPLLNGGAAGLQEMRERAIELGGVLSTETARASEGFNDNLEDMKFGLTGLKNILGTAVLPTLTKWIGFLTDSVVLLQKFTKSVLESDRALAVLKVAFIFASVAAAAFLALNIANQVAASGASFLQLASLLFFVAKAFTVMGAKALVAWLKVAAPIVGVIALITGIILVIEDLITFVNGGTSAFGALLKKMRESGGSMKFLADGLELLFGGGLGNALFDAFEALEKVPGKILDAFVEAFDSIMASIGPVLGALTSGLGAIPGAFASAGQALLGGGSDPAQLATGAVGPGGAVTNNISSSADIRIDAGNAGSPAELEPMVRSVVNQEMAGANRAAIRQLNNGMVR